jgi:hypothetical protein
MIGFLIPGETEVQWLFFGSAALNMLFGTVYLKGRNDLARTRDRINISRGEMKNLKRRMAHIRRLGR